MKITRQKESASPTARANVRGERRNDKKRKQARLNVTREDQSNNITDQEEVVKCRRCGPVVPVIKYDVKPPHYAGAYCPTCNKWFKWLPKPEWVKGGDA